MIWLIRLQLNQLLSCAPRHKSSGFYLHAEAGGLIRRFLKNNNFTITPWLALDILLYDGDKVESQGDRYENDEVQLFPSIQFGYRF